MWSGPRTVSTAMMRSFASRGDCAVVDEPLYAYYLANTGLRHPGRDEILASQPRDWRTVLRRLTTDPLPAGCSTAYQKQMTHHVLPDVDRAALAPLTHAFLIRDPRALLASYAKVRGEPTLADLGLPQQVELFERFGGPVLDSADVRADPAAALGALCEALGLAFDPAMLAWPAGPQPSDGVWGRHWYDGVWASTGFASADPSRAEPVLDPRLEPLLAACLPYYETLAAHRLRT